MTTNNHFINPNRTKNGEVCEDSSSLKKYRKDKKRLGKTWEYFDKPVLYNQNPESFRTTPFANIKWEDSVVVFGCSNVYGIGLANEDTITHQLEQILDMPVINLGIPGTGIDLAAVNSLILHEHYPTPKAVVHLWSGADRYTDFTKDTTIPMMPKRGVNRFGKTYIWTLDWSIRSKHYILADNALWRNKTCYYEASYFTQTCELLNIDLIKIIDEASDLAHPGTKSAKAGAIQIAEALLKQGIRK